MRNLFSPQIAERLGVTLATLHKKEFQQRLKLPIKHMGKRIYIPEPLFDQWALNPNGEGNEQG